MSERRILQRSVHTERSLASPRPRLRGMSHRVAAALAVPLGLTWIVLAPAGRPRVAVTVFTLGITVMFGFSALLHLRTWSPYLHERLLRLDHTGIYLAIAGTGIALALLGFDGWPGRFLLACFIVGAGAGIVTEWLPFAAPRGFNNAIYLTIGGVPVIMLPWLWMASGPLVVALMLGGAALYTTGVVIVGLRRPRLSLTWFGFHELFHVLVIAAVVVHTAMVAVLVQRAR